MDPWSGVSHVENKHWYMKTRVCLGPPKLHRVGPAEQPAGGDKASACSMCRALLRARGNVRSVDNSWGCLMPGQFAIVRVTMESPTVPERTTDQWLTRSSHTTCCVDLRCLWTTPPMIVQSLGAHEISCLYNGPRTCLALCCDM